MEFRIAVSCDSLFDGVDDAGDPKPGLCFPVVKAMHDWGAKNEGAVLVAVISKREPTVGGRMLRVLGEAGLSKAVGFFSSGAPVGGYLSAMEADMFLASDAQDAQAAIDQGIPAAVMHGMRTIHEGEELRIALDGDGVLFDCETERLYQEHGLDRFLAHELEKSSIPLNPGPLLPFLAALNRIRNICGRSLFRTALVTARSGVACERPIRTLETLGIPVDEALFCGDLPKLGVLKAFGAHVFFDDSERHLGPASEHMPTGRVLWRSIADQVERAVQDRSA